MAGIKTRAAHDLQKGRDETATRGMMAPMERLLRIRAKILSALTTVEAEDLRAAEAMGRYLATPVLARLASPPYTCAAMDGYAVRAAEVTGEIALPVAQAVYAGEVPEPLAPGHAARIFTGATLPPGADAVVREEAVAIEGGSARFRAPAHPAENVRLAGEDVAEGDEALPAGVRIGARQAALLAAVGAGTVRVRRRLRVAVVSTGDELLSGRLPDSNGEAVAAVARAAGAEVRRSSAGDRLEALAAALAEALRGADAVVTIGGVSVGSRDLVPAALERLGAETRVHGVPMKPGKPFLFALAGGRPVLGLPGSPSACLAALEVFARPALLALAGAARIGRPAVPLHLAEPAHGKPGRARLLWARLDPDGRARPLGRDTAQVRGPALADVLLCIPEDAGDLPAGAEVAAWLLADDAA